jgi:GntR family transcriptional regulator, transcriptional repressor for pyruvate dehydrogenase complex
MMLMPTKDGHQFQVVRNNKLSSQISVQLVESIFSGRFKPGDQLPPERDLALMFETSRVVVREALGTLLAKGVTSTRQGSGTTVNPIDQWNTLDPVILMLRDGDDTFDQLHEVRRIIEPELCALAAERITPEELEVLRPLSELRLDDTIEVHIDRDTSFHMAIARATKNTVLQIVMSSISDLLRESRRRSYIMPGEVADAREWHRRIFAAIEGHNAAAARQAMVEHMSQVRHALNAYKNNNKENQFDDHD